VGELERKGDIVSRERERDRNRERVRVRARKGGRERLL
jgi:hypothetical protein